ncbi:MAG: peptide chain release factor N(5)-glutamine methyltransferase [Lachnospiraceae bacterium]|nr:peptide chain release factor N(5)-glutamine methyltransferase [Lachnospiraceae bacterium]
MTYQELLTTAKNAFTEVEIREPDIDAKLLLLHVTGFSSAELFLHLPDEAPREKEEKLLELVEKRKTRYPLQYIIGEQEFYGLSFKVSQDCLIPRADTEILIDEVLKVIKDGDELLDTCTGSGCVLITLMKHRKLKSATGLDISEKALKMAKENAKRHEVNPKWIHSDLFEKVTDKYDVITSNPPYIDSEVLKGLQPEVKDFEPNMALDGGKDGLEPYRPLCEGAFNHLKDGGYFLTEIGYDQGEAVRKIFEEAGFSEVEVIKDLAADDRVVKGKRNVR